MAVGTSQFSPLEALGQTEFVEEVLSQAVLWILHLAHIVLAATHLLENMDLIIQTVILQEVAEVCITFPLGQLVQIQWALVDGHLHVEGIPHGLQAPMQTVTV